MATPRNHCYAKRINYFSDPSIVLPNGKLIGNKSHNNAGTIRKNVVSLLKLNPHVSQFTLIACITFSSCGGWVVASVRLKMEGCVDRGRSLNLDPCPADGRSCASIRYFFVLAG